MVIPPGAAAPTAATHRSEDSNPAGPYYNVKGVDDHLKMVVNSSRFLTLDKKIPQVQVNNPDVLDVMPISPNQVQISAKRTGVTQVNLWGEDKRIYTVNVVVTGDAAELTEILRELFPKTSLTIVPVNGNSVVISGYVDQQDAVPKIVSVAGKYFPDVINNMTVSGVQQGMLHVKVFEVSRTKLRNMGFDWANLSSNGNLVWSGVNGLLSTAAGRRSAGRRGQRAGQRLQVQHRQRQRLLRRAQRPPRGRSCQAGRGTGPRGHQRPARLYAGGRRDWLSSHQRPERHHGRLQGIRHAAGFRAHRAGQRPHAHRRPRPRQRARRRQQCRRHSFADNPRGRDRRGTAGRADAGHCRLDRTQPRGHNHGLPWISDIPYLGVPFRSVSHQTNEVELLVLVTPEIVDGMEPGQVPACMPGMETTDPSDWELFFKGHLEVPNCCPDDLAACQSCPASGGSAGSTPGEGPISRQNPQNPYPPANQMAMNPQPAEPGFIGPIGYDVLK